MTVPKALHQRLLEEFGGRLIERMPIPLAITDNLNPAFPIRPYQKKALQYFLSYWQETFEGKPAANHQLLFHMATGSGKTLLMAALIIYLYEEGYRNFLFFVNSNNIIDKTRDNFLNRRSAKHLFAQEIVIGDKRVAVREVSNFQDSKDDAINIVFSTIQGLHLRLNVPSEDALTCEDFEGRRVVLISDEAHHLNVDTKKGTGRGQLELLETVSWESTVERVHRANPGNVLLEFTATVDFEQEALAAKYLPRLIYDYPLRDFRRDGYSKEVRVLQADIPRMQRALQAVLLSQYRRKIFERHKKRIKPVVLFKSKTIRESQEFFEDFRQAMRKLTSADLKAVEVHAEDPALKRMFAGYKATGITLENLIAEIKEDFSDEKLISVNSKEESEQKQLAVNSLEDERNEYRAVFAVDKLNEGWDVLNLFDIVRLYDTRDNKANKTGKTTMSEAQLIGRGARYCPFQISDEQPLFQRKYDQDLGQELRICEELYYHSAYNPKYIRELNAALQEIGIKAKETRERSLLIKPEFKATPVYKAGHIFLNGREKVSRDDVDSLEHAAILKRHEVALRTGFSQTSGAFDDERSERAPGKAVKEYRLTAFGPRILRRAIQRLDFYAFDNLRRFLPRLKSISEFISSDRYLGRIVLQVSGTPEDVETLSQRQKLDAAVQVLAEISTVLQSDKVDFRGTTEFQPYMVKETFSDKTLSFMSDAGEDQEYGRSMNDPAESSFPMDLGARPWYVFQDCYGTSEEKRLLLFLDRQVPELRKRFGLVYVFRNEKHFKLYNFDDGSALEPDFLLYLGDEKRHKKKRLIAFIEPKGKHLLKEDEWKEKFLLRLKNEAKIEQVFENQEFTVLGLPFFNEELRLRDFSGAFQELLDPPAREAQAA